MGKSFDYFWLLPLAMVAYFAWRFFRNGSITGALLGGRITNTVGEIELESSALSSRLLKVHVLEAKSDSAPQVALAIVSKAALVASLVPIKLSQAQAKQLASLLERASS